METANSKQEFPDNIPGIALLREEGAWKYIDVAAGVPRESLLAMLREMPHNRELCFFEYNDAQQVGDEGGLYVMLQTFRNACYFWKGGQGKETNLERMDISEAADFILANLGPKDAFLYLVPMARRFEERTDFRWHDAPERAADNQAEILRHLLATVALRFQLVVAEAGMNFGDFAGGQGVRTPSEIVFHMRDVLTATWSKLTNAPRPKLTQESWDGEVAGLHAVLAQLDRALLTATANEMLYKKLLQGPLSDVLTHVGQLSMLRRMFGNPLPGRNYFAAPVRTGNTSENQI